MLCVGYTLRVVLVKAYVNGTLTLDPQGAFETLHFQGLE